MPGQARTWIDRGRGSNCSFEKALRICYSRHVDRFIRVRPRSTGATCRLEADLLGNTGVFEDHRLLQIQAGSDTRGQRPVVHSQTDGDIHIGEADGVEIDPLALILTADFVARYQLVQIGVDGMRGP